MNNKLKEATKVVSFIMVILLALTAVFFAIRSGKYVVSTSSDDAAKNISTLFGTMNSNLYALILVLISLWLFVGCTLAFITGFDASREYSARSHKGMIILGITSLIFMAWPSGVLELLLARQPRQTLKK